MSGSLRVLRGCGKVCREERLKGYFRCSSMGWGVNYHLLGMSAYDVGRVVRGHLEGSWVPMVVCTGPSKKLVMQRKVTEERLKGL